MQKPSCGFRYRRPMRQGLTSLVVSCFIAGSAHAQVQPPPTYLPPVMVVGGRMADSTPASVDSVDVRPLPAREGSSVAEVLRRVPGVVARDRQNLAQDVQVTIRGFGARSTFGVRGLRLYVDGIPASMPDGQGQVSHVPLGALAEVVVLRGPFSALYGNASGGVIQFFSATPADRPAFLFDGMAAGDGRQRWHAAASGPWRHAGGGYRVDAERLDSDGFRDHSRARRDVAQMRLTTDTARGARVALTSNSLDLEAQDPQGLTLAQALATPRAASAGALAFDTRKRVRQRQVGARFEQPLSRGELAIGVYAGARSTFQMLSVPVAAQAAPGSGGGVIALDRGYGGLDARWSLDGTFAGRAAGLTVGAEWQQSSERRRGFENFAGVALGVVGALRRDQRDRVHGRDAYAEARWAFMPRWQATLGLRHSQVGFRSADDYIAPGNPDDSGRIDYAFTTSAAGLLYRPTASMELYANAGRGFETPSSSELAYRPDGASGLNTALRPSRTRSFEGGLRLHRHGRELAFAVFDSRTRDELMVASSDGGRSIYANAADTHRRGLELSASGPVATRWRYAIALTALDAGFQGARRRIPGTTARNGWAELRWAPRDGIELFVAGEAGSRLYADDANTAWAPGHATMDLGAERRWQLGRMAVAAFARIDNLLDRRAIGSVIVNDGNGRYFEPAPGRTYLLGLRIAAK
jgi:iron complex outermembrane receptor protein